MGQRQPGFARVGFRRVGAQTAGPWPGNAAANLPVGPAAGGTIAGTSAPSDHQHPTPIAATAAALAAVDASTWNEGSQIYLATVRATFILTASTQSALSLVRVAALNKAGFQWIREDLATGRWASQFAWTINGTTGNDENVGDAGNPLKTWAELGRRLNGNVYIGSAQNVTVTVAASTPADDVPRLNIVCKQDESLGTIAAFWIIGTPTTLYSGSITGGVSNITLASFPTTSDQEFADTAIPVSFTASGLVGKLWKRTGGTRQYAWIAKDLGAKTARCSIPLNTRDTVGTFGGTTITAMANTQTYDVVDLPTIAAPQLVNADPNTVIVVQTCRVIGDSLGNQTGCAPNTQFRLCSIASLGLNNGQLLSNCYIESAAAVYVDAAGAAVTLTGGAINGTGATAFGIINYASVLGGATVPIVFQGAVLSVLHRGNFEVLQALFYDTTTAMISLQGMSRVNLAAQGGSGNSGKICVVNAGGDLALVTTPTVTPASTSDANPFQVGGTSYATVAEASIVFATSAAGLMSTAAPAKNSLATVYVNGSVAGDQTMPVSDADGGGVVIDGSNAGTFAGATASLTVKGNTNLAAVSALIVNGQSPGAGKAAIELTNGAQTLQATANPLLLYSSNNGVLLQANQGGTGSNLIPVEADSGLALSKFTDVASANTITIPANTIGGTLGGNLGNITGTTDVRFLTLWTAKNPVITMRFPNGLTVKHNFAGPPGGTANFNLAGAADYVAGAGAKLTVYYDNVLGQWVEMSRST